MTIIPRGRALGVTMALPEKDATATPRAGWNRGSPCASGGRIAEQLIYGESHLNSGAADDIRQATGMARRMVTEFG